MIDVAIIGGGPAALSAAINCRRRNKTVKIFARGLDTSMLFTAEKVDNYPGLPDMGGEELLNRFQQHAIQSGVTFQRCRISQILPMGDHFMINAENEFVEARAIILATGIHKSRGIQGEAEAIGKGVSYCATCDGMLYRGKKVVVVGENEEGEAEANFLADICTEVTYVPLYEPVLYLKENVTVMRTKPLAVVTENGVLTGLETKDGVISCDGIFFAKNSMPPDSLIYGLKTEGAQIVTDKRMATNLPFVYAAGDCTGAPYQIAKAVGEGQVAALSAVQDLDAAQREAAKAESVN